MQSGAKWDVWLTYAQELGVSEHTLLQARCQEVHMVLHQLVDGPLRHALLLCLVDRVVFRLLPMYLYIASTFCLLCLTQAPHEAIPIRLDDFARTEVQQLLHKTEHTRS